MNTYFWNIAVDDQDHHLSVRMGAIYFRMGYILTPFVKAFLTLTIVKGEGKFTLTFDVVAFSERTLHYFEIYIISYSYTLAYWKYL